MHSVNVKGDTFLYVGSNVFVLASVEFDVSNISCLLHSSMYQVLSITTVPEPLSAGFIIISYGLSFCSSKVIMSSFGFQCNRCNLQYIGGTKRRLKD